MSASFAVALAQLRCSLYDRAHNLRITVEAVEQAAERGAELTVLPELAASGYGSDPVALRGLAESLEQPGPVLEGWSEVAARTGTAVCGGFVETDGERLYNAVVMIGPDGGLLGTYRKLHLFAAEQQVFTPGDRGLPIFELGERRVGVLVCYDLRFPEVMRILALRGAELIAVPTAWVAGFDRHVPDDGPIGQVTGALVQANLDAVYVACADQVGRSEGVRFLGRSVIGDPFGDPVVGPLDPQQPDLVVHELDLTALERARHRGPGIDPLDNRRTDVYGELLGYRAPSLSTSC